MFTGESCILLIQDYSLHVFIKVLIIYVVRPVNTYSLKFKFKMDIRGCQLKIRSNNNQIMIIHFQFTF